MREKRRVVLVGCGMVGMSYAYAMMNQQTCDELVLIDYNKQKADGEAMDLNHGLAFSGSHMRIWSGTYEDCKDADIVTITAGVAQQPGETRLALLERNTAVFKSIIEPVTDSGFNGIFLIATNPVDVMTKITCELSGFNPKRVIGSGTSLDTARLRYLVGDYLKVDPRSEDLEKIEVDVRTAAYKIIEAKKATYYGIGIALNRLTKSILGDENSVQTVSAYLRGEYGQTGIFIGVPAIINAQGVQSVLECHLTADEQERFDASCNTLREYFVH